MSGRVNPARRKPIKKGEQLARSHGAHARVEPHEIEPNVQAIYALLEAQAPLREADGTLPAYDVAAVELLATVMVRLRRISDAIEQHGVLKTSRGQGDSVLKAEARYLRIAKDLLEQLGMTPASRAKLGLDLARTAVAAQQVEVKADDDRAAEVARILDDVGALPREPQEASADDDVLKAKRRPPEPEPPIRLGGLMIKRQ